MGQAPSAHHFQVLAREDEAVPQPKNQLPPPIGQPPPGPPLAGQPPPGPPLAGQQPPGPPTPGPDDRQSASLNSNRRDAENKHASRRQHARRLASIHYERFPDDSPFYVPRYQVDNPETAWQDDFFFLGLGEKDDWERRELERVRHHFRKALRESSAKYEYLVYDVTLVGNGKLLAHYAAVSNRDDHSCRGGLWDGDLDSDSERLVFHGTRESNISKIVAQGFRRKGARDPGWYGQGYYLTSNPEYAVHYLSEVELRKEEDGMKRIPAGGEAIVIAAYVHLGKSFQVKDMSFFGKPLKEGFDSHHVFVKAHTFTPTLRRCDAVADEIVFDGTERILPHYIISFRRKPTRLVWLLSDCTPRITELRETICNAVASKGHSVHLCQTLREAEQEMQHLLRVDSDKLKEVVRFAVTGNFTASVLQELCCPQGNTPVIVISTVGDFDQHIRHVRKSSSRVNMVTYSPKDVQRFADASNRELVDDDGHLLFIQEKSTSHPIAAAASRFHRL